MQDKSARCSFLILALREQSSVGEPPNKTHTVRKGKTLPKTPLLLSAAWEHDYNGTCNLRRLEALPYFSGNRAQLADAVRKHLTFIALKLPPKKATELPGWKLKS